MTPAISLAPAENNQSYSTLTFESLYCSTAEKLYKRIKIRTPPIIPPHIHQVGQLPSFYQFLQEFVTSKLEVLHAPEHIQFSSCPPIFHQAGKQTGCQDLQEIQY